jgi:hypothetical protein
MEHTGGVMDKSIWILCILLGAALFVCGTAAAEDGVRNVKPGDTIFLYQEHLNLEGLRNPGTNNPITALRLYVGENPSNAVILEIPVYDDTDFTADHVLLEMDENLGAYFAYNPVDGPTARLRIQKQELLLGITLADPYHGESVEGMWLPQGTQIAFEITSPLVGTYYYQKAKDSAPPVINILIEDSQGRDIYQVGNRDLRGIVIDSDRFYTDEPGKPGPISLHLLDEGEYAVQAIWAGPADFLDAKDSNRIHFIVGEKVGIEVTPIPTPTPAPTPVVTTEAPTPVPEMTQNASVTEATAEPTALPTTAPPTIRPTEAPIPELQDELPAISGPLLFIATIGAVCAIPVITLLGRNIIRRRKD